MDIGYDPRDPFFSAAMTKFEKACAIIGINPAVRHELSQPMYEQIFHIVIPVGERLELMGPADSVLRDSIPSSKIDRDRAEILSDGSLGLNSDLLATNRICLSSGILWLESNSMAYRIRKGVFHTLKCYRVQYNDARGPFFGCLHFHGKLNLDFCKATAAETVWMSSAVNIPFGGAFGGIKMDPEMYTNSEIESILKAYARAIRPFVGPERDILAPGHSLTSEYMNRVMRFFLEGDPKRHLDKGCAVGKDPAAGGISIRDRATGLGLSYCIEEWFKTREEKRRGVSVNTWDLNFSTMSFSIQGFGSDGASCARALAARGAKCVAVDDRHGTIYSHAGLDVEELYSYVHENQFNKQRSVLGYPNAEYITKDEFWSIGCTVMVLASMPWTVDAVRAKALKAELLAEAESNSTTQEADEILESRGIEILPGIIGGAGSTVAGYYEWLQNQSLFNWEEERILTDLAFAMKTNYSIIKDISNNTPRLTRLYDSRPFGVGTPVDTRTAAMILALRRIEKQYLLAGPSHMAGIV